MKKYDVIFDLDGTLSIMSDRISCIKGVNKNYEEFHSRVHEDDVNKPVRQVLWGLRKSKKSIAIVTGRRESSRLDTLAWLSRNLMHFDTEDVFMRPPDCYEKAEVLKADLAREFIDGVTMAFEDDPDVVAMWRGKGLICFDIGRGEQ